jgi:hypothetical protein
MILPSRYRFRTSVTDRYLFSSKVTVTIPLHTDTVHYRGKLKFQITNQQITIRTKFSGLKIEDIPKQSMQQCAAKFAAPDFPI